MTANRFAVVCLGLGCFCFALAACLGMSSQDLNATVEAAQLNAAAYHRSDGGPERALARAAACAELGVLRRNGVDAGVGIDCPVNP